MNQSAQINRSGLFWQTNIDENAIWLQHVEVCGVVQIAGAHRTQNNIEGIAQSFERTWLARSVVIRRTQALTVIFFRTAVRNNVDFCAHRGSNLHVHMSQTAHTEHSYLLARACLPTLKRGVGGNACAQKRSRGFERDSLRNAAREVFAHGKALCVTAGRRVTVLIGAIGEVGVRVAAELFFASLAVLALLTRSEHATNAYLVANLKLSNLVANFLDNAHELVTRNQRIVHWTPFAAGGVNIAVANAGVLNVEVDFVVRRFADFNGGAMENRGLIVARISKYLRHCLSFD